MTAGGIGRIFCTESFCKSNGIDLATGMLSALIKELLRLKEVQGIQDDEFYHYDTPLTVQHEKEALLTAGFSSVEELKSWGATFTLKAYK